MIPKKQPKKHESEKSKKSFVISTSTSYVNGNVQNVEEEEVEVVGAPQTTIGKHLEVRALHLRVIEVRQTETLEGLRIDGAEDELVQNSSIPMSLATEGLAHLGGHGLCPGRHRSHLHGGESDPGRNVSILLVDPHYLLDVDLGMVDKGTEDQIMVMIVIDPTQLPNRLAHVHLEDVLTKNVALAHPCLAVQLLPLDLLAEIAIVGADTRRPLQQRTSLILVP